MSVWDTYGMKMEIILAKSWIQTSKKGYGIRFDVFLKWVLVYIFVWLRGRGRILVKNQGFLTICSRSGFV